MRFYDADEVDVVITKLLNQACDKEEEIYEMSPPRVMSLVSREIIFECKEYEADMKDVKQMKEQIEKMKCCGNCNCMTPDGYCTTDESKVQGWDYCDSWKMDEQKTERKE